MYQRDVILPAQIPVLSDRINFLSWLDEVETQFYFVHLHNHSVNALLVCNALIPRLLASINVPSVTQLTIYKAYEEFREQVLEPAKNNEEEEVIGSVLATFGTFKEFCIQLVGHPTDGAYKKKIMSWSSSGLPRKKIYEEALKFSQNPGFQSLIREGLKQCSESEYTLAFNKSDDASVGSIVKHMVSQNEKETFVSGIEVLNLSFGHKEETVEVNLVNSSYKSKKDWKQKKFQYQKKKFKCFKCGKEGHKAFECRSKIKKINSKYISDLTDQFLVKSVVNGIEGRALIDSGANISLINETMVNKMKKVEINREIQTCKSANGGNIRVSGYITTDVMLNGLKNRGTLWISNDISYDVIIGLDYLEENDIKIHWNPRRLVCGIGKSNKFDDLKKEYKDLFVEKLDNKIGGALVEPVEIKLEEETTPSYIRNRRLSESEKIVIEEEVRTMLKNDVIEEVKASSSSKGWNSPVLLIKKKDGNWRFCVDFRKLNAATLKDSSQLPRVDDILDSVTRSKVFSKLDLASGYWQIPVHEDSRHLLTFESMEKQYRFKVLPFGVTNAPALFQKMIYNIVRGIKGVECLIDDIIIHSMDEETNLKTTKMVLERLEKYKLKLNNKKCIFGKRSIDMFGYTIENGKLQIEKERADAISKVKLPIDEKELLSFLGMANYYRRLIKGYASIEKDIRECLKEKEIVWTAESKEAFEKMKRELTRLPFIYSHDPKQSLELMTDASGKAVGATLNQVNGESKIPIGFYSRILKDTETRYSTIEKELLAIHDACEHFRPYLIGLKFKIMTDHKPLIPILRKKTTPFGPRWSRRMLRLSEYDYEIEHIDGKKNVVADLFSRTVASIYVEVGSLKEAQEWDKEIQDVKNNDKRVLVENDIVTMVYKNGIQVIVLPKVFQYRAISEAHDSKYGGHFGVKHTVAKLKQNYYWKSMYQDVEKYIKGCRACTESVRKKMKINESLHIEKGDVWQNIAIDFIGPIKTSNEKKFILIAIDTFSKYVETRLVDNQTSEIVIRFLEEIFFKHGFPKKVLSDNGSQFVAMAVKEFYERNRIKGVNSTPYNPQGNGIVERSIRTVKGSLRKSLEGKDVSEKILREITYSYNTSVHSSTKYSPFYILYNRYPKLPLRQILTEKEEISVDERVIEGDRRKNETFLRVDHSLAKLDNYHDRYLYEKNKIEDRNFEVNDKVLIFDEKPESSMSMGYKGPYIINEKLNDQVFKVEGFSKPVNIRRIKKFVKGNDKHDLIVENENTKEATISLGELDIDEFMDIESSQLTERKKIIKEICDTYLNEAHRRGSKGRLRDSLNVFMKSGIGNLINILQRDQSEAKELAEKFIEDMKEGNFQWHRPN